MNSNCKSTRFVAPEANLRDANNAELPPIDFLIECGASASLRALPCEVKATITMNRQHVVDELAKLSRYAGPLHITEENGTTKQYPNYCVVFIVNQLDSERVAEIMEDSVKTGSLRLPNSFAMWEFGIVASPKVGQHEVLSVRNKKGASGCSEIDPQLTSGIVVPLEENQRDYELLKFTPLKPPLVYTLFLLWQGIFAYLSKGERKLTTSVDAVLKEAQEYYGRWNEHSPIRREWIREAMDSLCAWGLATRDKELYTIDLHQPKEKDLKKYFCKKSCKEESVFADADDDQRLVTEF